MKLRATVQDTRIDAWHKTSATAPVSEGGRYKAICRLEAGATNREHHEVYDVRTRGGPLLAESRQRL